MSEKTAIAEICETYGLKQAEIARYFSIPLRTVQDWHAGRRTPPDYVINMMVKLLDIDKKINHKSQKTEV